MKTKFLFAVMALLGGSMVYLIISRTTLSSLYPCKPFFLFDAYCLPTLPGEIKTSNGLQVFFAKIPDKPWVEVSVPFSCDHPVECTQANASQYGRTHFYTNTAYAIDICSLPGQPVGKIYAIFGGKAFVQDGCSHPAGTTSEVHNVCGCGDGFGNNVRITQPDGTWAMYAHLSEIFVKDGEMVKAGTCIGVEGVTGKAGKRHLHFSVHKTFGEHPEELEQYQTPGLSVPFMWRIRFKDETEYRLRSSLEVKVGQIFYGDRCYSANTVL